MKLGKREWLFVFSVVLLVVNAVIQIVDERRVMGIVNLIFVVIIAYGEWYVSRKKVGK